MPSSIERPAGSSSLPTASCVLVHLPCGGRHAGAPCPQEESGQGAYGDMGGFGDDGGLGGGFEDDDFGTCEGSEGMGAMRAGAGDACTPQTWDFEHLNDEQVGAWQRFGWGICGFTWLLDARIAECSWIIIVDQVRLARCPCKRPPCLTSQAAGWMAQPSQSKPEETVPLLPLYACCYMLRLWAPWPVLASPDSTGCHSSIS